MLQGITRRATRRNETRSPSRKQIRSSSSKGRSPNRGFFQSSSSPTSRNQRKLIPSNYCAWILSMLLVGFLFHAGVLKWSMIHTGREEAARHQNDAVDDDGKSQSLLVSPYDHRGTPISENTQVPYTDVKPHATQDHPSSITSGEKPNIRQTEPSNLQEMGNGQKQLRETQSTTDEDPEKQRIISFQPRYLALGTNDETPIYYKVSTTVQQLVRRDSQSEQIEMILPIPNVTAEISQLDSQPGQSQDEENSIDKNGKKTLSPLQERREQCIPQESWQTDYLINCNQLHELDMVSGSVASKLKFLGQGWFRAAWKFSFDKYSHEEGTVTISQEGLVLKTLRMEREFLDEYYELHRRDAVAMERLTWSPYVMDVYGYCGQSALNELAFFKKDINNLEQLDRAMRNLKQKDKADREKVEYMKLKLATSVATGISHVHQVHSPSSILPGKPSSNRGALMAHYDINPRNIAIVAGGKPKLNDFNIAEFIQYNPNTNQSCGFPSRLHEPWWRAPEEMYIPEDVEVDMKLVTEKVDVYALGAVLFHILTTHSPRGKMKKERMEQVREVVARGVAPTLVPYYYNISDDSPAVQAIRQAMDLCFVVDPVQRGSARQVANILQKALKVYEQGESEEEEGTSEKEE